MTADVIFLPKYKLNDEVVHRQDKSLIGVIHKRYKCYDEYCYIMLVYNGAELKRVRVREQDIQLIQHGRRKQ